MRLRLGSCALLWLSLSPLQTWAHAHLLDTEPPANAVIAQAPKQLRLRFSEPIEKKFVRLQIQVAQQPLALTPDSVQWDANGKTMLVNLPESASGVYQVQWSILARDGHPGKGQYSFTVKP
jgi:methionine-rich copper-binding protein CopC